MAKADTPDVPQAVGPKGLLPPRPASGARSHYEREVPLLGDVPRASLDGPEGRAYDLSPSPVPRVSLLPPSESREDESGFRFAPNPASRHLPTVAARNLERAPRPGAPAVTAPPQRRSSSKLVARRLVEDVRSSKREIMLGLIIGIGLSALLGAVVKRYLDRPYVEPRGAAAHVPPPLTTEQLGLEPDPAPPPAELAVPAPELAETEAPAPEPPAVRDTSAAGPGREARVMATSGAPEPHSRPRRSAKKRAARVEPAPKEQSPPPAEPPPSPAEPRRSAPLSPSESAGLGLELPL